jgi:hypothetical protein
MQALSDERRIDLLETKVDEGFARMEQGFTEVRTLIVSSERALRSEIISVRSEARADFRTLIAVVFAMWTATVLAVVGVLVSHI